MRWSDAIFLMLVAVAIVNVLCVVKAGGYAKEAMRNMIARGGKKWG